MDDISFNSSGLQPTGEPEAVTSRFESDGDPLDRAPVSHGFQTPAMQQLQQAVLINGQFLKGLALQPWDESGDQPTRLPHLDYGDQSRALIKWDQTSARIDAVCHEVAPSLTAATMVPASLRCP
jgi:hypothetical protein